MDMCIYCGPTCYGGAAHNARAEDGVIYTGRWKPRVYKAGLLWVVERETSFFVSRWQDAMLIALALVDRTMKENSHDC